MDHKRPPWAGRRALRGFTLIELIIVLTLVGFVYTLMPEIDISGIGNDNKINQFLGDVRGAYDLAVLSGRAHRIVVDMASGDYWIESTQRADFRLGMERVDHDLTESDIEEQKAAFEEDFEEYLENCGTEVKAEDDETVIPPACPIVEARADLAPIQWQRVTTSEWVGRSLGPDLMVVALQAEHHGRVQQLEDGEPGMRGVIHFLPSGYVENAFLHVYYRRDSNTWYDPDEVGKKPYTIMTKPYEGIAVVEAGVVEVSVHEDQS